MKPKTNRDMKISTYCNCGGFCSPYHKDLHKEDMKNKISKNKNKPMKANKDKYKHHKYCGGYSKDDNGEIIICKGECLFSHSKKLTKQQKKQIKKHFSIVKEAKANIAGTGGIEWNEYRSTLSTPHSKKQTGFCMSCKKIEPLDKHCTPP